MEGSFVHHPARNKYVRIPAAKKIKFVLKESTAGSDKGEWSYGSEQELRSCGGSFAAVAPAGAAPLPYVASRKKLDPPRLVKMPDNQVIGVGILSQTLAGAEGSLSRFAARDV